MTVDDFFFHQKNLTEDVIGSGKFCSCSLLVICRGLRIPAPCRGGGTGRGGIGGEGKKKRNEGRKARMTNPK